MTSRPPEADPFAPIIRQIQQGIDTELNYSRLYHHFHPRLWRYFLCRGMAPTAAEDLCQDVLFNAFRNLGTFEGRSRFERWLFEIAHNLYINDLRRWGADKRDVPELPLREENPPGEDDPPQTAPALAADGPSPYDETVRRDETERLRAAVERLSPQQRNCIYLQVYQGLKYHEVAEVMKVSIDTVKAHLGQAKVRLRQLLSDQ